MRRNNHVVSFGIVKLTVVLPALYVFLNPFDFLYLSFQLLKPRLQNLEQLFFFSGVSHCLPVHCLEHSQRLGEVGERVGHVLHRLFHLAAFVHDSL